MAGTHGERENKKTHKNTCATHTNTHVTHTQHTGWTEIRWETAVLLFSRPWTRESPKVREKKDDGVGKGGERRDKWRRGRGRADK